MDPTYRDFMPDSMAEEPPPYLVLIREKALGVIREADPRRGDQLDHLVEMAGDDSDPDAISAAIEAFANAGAEVLPLLERRMGIENVPDISVIRCLGAIARHSPRAVDLLSAAAESDEPMSQREVARAFEAIVDDDESGRHAAPILGSMLRASKHQSVRRAALRAIAQIGPAAEGSAVEVKKLIDGPDDALRQDAIYALSRIAPKSDDSVLAMMKLRGAADDSEGRTRAIDVLLTLDPPRPADHLVPTLANLLDDPDNDLRLRVLRRLAALGDGARSAGPRVARIVDNNAPEIRAAAVRTLMSIGPDDQALAAGLIAAVRRKDEASVEQLSKRVASSSGARELAIVKLKKIEVAEPDPAEQSTAKRTIDALGPR